MPDLDLDALKAVVVARFPNLAPARFSLLTEGWHSIAVDADDALIFKFPRNRTAEKALRTEASILAAVRPHISMPVPVFSPGPWWCIIIVRIKGCAMGQVLHGSATTTEAIRRAIQNSQESLRALAKRYGINQKTVRKWRNRTSVTDLPTGPKEPKSTVLSIEEEAIVVAFRKHTLLPLDDCLYALQPTIPHLSRSSLHRCLQRHGIGRLPDVEGDTPAKKKFKSYPIGYFHIDIAEVQTAEGKLYLYVAIDRTSKFAFVQVVRKTGRTSASAFLMALIEAVPYKIHTVLTDNGIQFTFPPRYADGPTARHMTHMFDMRCQENGIEHRLTKVKHPWTNGQVERMNRTIKEATVNRYHYDSHQQLEAHLADFVSAYNFGRRLKTLKGLTPYEFICKVWTIEPQRFRFNPLHQMPGLNT